MGPWQPPLRPATPDRASAVGLVVVGASFHYLGPSFAVLLFAHLDAMGVAWLRMASAALVLALVRPPWTVWRAAGRDERLLVVALGGVLAAMNATFYLALDRLPLATVAGIEFLGVDRAGGVRRAHPPQRARARPHRRRRRAAHPGPHRRHSGRAAAGGGELRRLHALRRHRPPARQRALGAPQRRARPAQPRRGHRRGRCDAARHRRRPCPRFTTRPGCSGGSASASARR